MCYPGGVKLRMRPHGVVRKLSRSASSRVSLTNQTRKYPLKLSTSLGYRCATNTVSSPDCRAARNLGGEFCAFRHFTQNPPKTPLNPSWSEPNTAGWSMHRIPKQAICGSRARDDVFPNLIPFCHTRLWQCRYLLRTYEKPERAKAANNGIKNRVVRTSPQSNHPSCWAQ
jgi:hypothetical protein